MISPESIQDAAADAAAPSQLLASLVGIMSAHGESVDRLLELTAATVCAEQDARTLDRLMGVGGPVEHHGKYWDAERRADEIYFGEGREEEDESDEND